MMKRALVRACALSISLALAVTAMTSPGAPTGPTQAVVRVGTVAATPAPNAAVVWVYMTTGGDPVDLPYVAGYVPIAGDQVEVLFHATAGGSMAGLVIGGRSGQSANLVVNGDFSVGSSLTALVDNPPYMWSHYVALGGAAITGCAYLLVDYRQFGLMTGPDGVTTTDNRLVSASIPVTPGRTLQLTGAGKVTLGVSTTVTWDLRVGWFGDADSTWPAVVSETVGYTSGALVASQGLFGQATLTVPSEARYARVAVRIAYTGANVSSFYILHMAQVSLYRI